jgi:hypothetical protein
VPEPIFARRLIERISLRTHEVLIDIILAIGAATMILAIVR